MRILNFISSVTLIVLTQACATTGAEKIRAQKSVTAAVFPTIGAIYRPTAKIGIGATISASVRENDELTHSEENMKDFGSETFNVKESKSRGTNAFLHYYPWSTSAFFLGAGVKSESKNYSLAVSNDGTTLDSISPVNMTYSASVKKIRVPLGWNWIYESGFSMLLDIGPNVAVTETATSLLKNDQVDATKKEMLISDLSRDSKGALIEPMFTMGYSF
jgi:hypothetical protein